MISVILAGGGRGERTGRKIPKSFIKINKFFLQKIRVMELFHKKLDEIAEKIQYFEVRRKKIGELLRKINEEMKIEKDDEILDDRIIVKVPDRKFKKMRILGVDGGIVKHSYHGLDLILMRAVGVNFTYDEGKLKCP